MSAAMLLTGSEKPCTPRKRRVVSSASMNIWDNGSSPRISGTSPRVIIRRGTNRPFAPRIKLQVQTASTRTPTVARADGPVMSFQPPPPKRPKTHTSDESPRVISPDCCYHCLTRGGNAAYTCAKENGEERCTRCTRDKMAKCRLPTPQEAVKIAARCPRCAKRGFKQCDGGNPCDTCIRNKTERLCQATSNERRQLGRNSAEVTVTSGTNNTATGIEEANTCQTTRRQSRQKAIDITDATHDKISSAANRSTRAQLTRRRERIGRKSVADEGSACHGNAGSPIFEGTLLESDLQAPIKIEETADCFLLGSTPASPLVSQTVTTLSRSNPSQISGRKRKATQSVSSWPVAPQSFTTSLANADASIIGSQSPMIAKVPIRERNSTTKHPSDNVDIDMTEESEYHDVAGFKISRRPRRSQGRVSYAEIPVEAEVDYGLSIEDDSDTDVYIAGTTDEEIEEDEEDEEYADEDEDEDGEEEGEDEEHISLMDEHELCMVVDGDVETPEEMMNDDCNGIAEDEFMAILTHRFKEKKTKAISKPKAGKGIDFSLPPLDNVKDCFSDLAAKGLSHGLDRALMKFGSKKLRVATMCSGTESPLLALNEISRGLQEAGKPAINFRHEFSAEIEPVKQAYIERNFQPKILFRDVRDFLRAETTTATTAYGAEVDIPSEVDILVAGFVCKDLSRLNNCGKTLKDEGESGDTWLAIYTYAKRFRPRVVLLENVKATRKTWDDLVVEWDNIGYTAAWIYRDTKTYYLPQTRERMYMIAIENSQLGSRAEEAVSGWKNTIEKLQRQCSSPYESFIADSLQEPGTYATPLSEPDWPLCKLRYDHIRSREKLGNSSPITLSSGTGTVKPPDCASIPYYESQSSRVWDAIDIAHLQLAKEGSDSLYKMGVWDVSQNVDRFRAELGIVPCITPGGSDFASNRQQPLSGSQLLTLQGMPLDRLLFANETQRDRQDLAGNAMSTTVIGASLIAAITSCWRAFQSRKPHSSDTTQVKEAPDVTVKWLEAPGSVQKTSQKAQIYRQVDLTALQIDAKRSARLCHCEGSKLLCKLPVHECLACNHTACPTCAGNPKHEYHTMEIASSWRITPDEFIQSWRPKLPPRVRFEYFTDLNELASGVKLNTEYLHAIREAQLDLQYFCIGEFSRRSHNWTITYSSPKAVLELEVGYDLRWLLYIKCPANLPGHSSLRHFLKAPIAYADIGESLLHLQWKVQTPSGTKHQLRLSSSGGRSRSWRARLGLLDFQAETVPSQLSIKCNDGNLESLDGLFDYLPDCGTASSCLYKRSSDPPLYMFLDSNPIGPSKEDRVIFSYDCTRKHYGEGRITIASVDSSWRPWTKTNDQTSLITASQPGIWHSAVMPLTSACGVVEAYHLASSHLSSAAIHDCSRVLTCLDVHVQESLPIHAFHAYSWALEQPRSRPSFPDWQETVASSAQDCSCAPPYPQLHWNVDKKGVAIAQEDRKSAAVFERAVKSRPSAIQIKVINDSDHTRIRVGLNIASLLHRARASLGRGDPITTAWRLLTDHADIPAQPFAKFYLRSNTADTSVASALPSYLGRAQAKSLSWMITQEQGKEIIITEVEEDVHTGLGWRLEARAQTMRIVRGGVLADLPSFGKTVTTIALIQHEFNMNSPEAIIEQNLSTATTGASSLFNTAATLIVCPPHIAPQWRTEFEKFVKTKGFSLDDVLLIEDYASLKKLTMDHLRKSKAVIVAWALFADEEYISQLARFTAMPEPALTSRRAFDTWLSRASDEIPERLIALRDQSYQDFQASTTDLLQARLQQPQFQAALPVKIGHGSAYESFSSKQPLSKSQNVLSRNKTSLTGKASRSHPLKEVPLLHLFKFNRIVVDEYHYLNDEKIRNCLSAISVKQIAAHKRWVLSGTPAMANFSDIDQIASFLGISLGRTCLGDGTITTQAEKLAKADQTPVEDFLSRTEIKTRQWHQARHDRAQAFLDMFVRQNEAELQHIACAELLLPVQLDAAHYAVYLELSQHLTAQKMQLKKLSKRMGSDKTERLNESLNNSGSAEIALMKSALLFKTLGGQSGLESLKTKRAKQRQDAEVDLLGILCGLEGLMPAEKNKLRHLFERNRAAFTSRVAESSVALYMRFKQDIGQSDWLGDDDASNSIRRLLARAMKKPDQKKFPGIKGLPDEKRQRIMKQELSRVRELARELVVRTRSERFIEAVEEASRQPTNGQTQNFKCSAPDCIGASTREKMRIVTQCGHTACQGCLDNRIDDEACVHASCNSPVHEANIVRTSDLGSIENESSDEGFGRKLTAIAELVLGLPDKDQGIVFVQNEDFVSILGEVFHSFGITYHSTTQNKAAQSARNIEDFKTNKHVGKRKKMLILNLGSESAAGVNLVNANHIIFVSPLSVKTQYEYDSAMVQAIARSRRYGQQKQVHIYHVIAEQTIDVDILERRHKRDDGITTVNSAMKLPDASGTAKERTKLIKNKRGQMALVPRSWLNDEATRQSLDVEEQLKSFGSLIKFEGSPDIDDE